MWVLNIRLFSIWFWVDTTSLCFLFLIHKMKVLEEVFFKVSPIPKPSFFLVCHLLS